VDAQRVTVELCRQGAVFHDRDRDYRDGRRNTSPALAQDYIAQLVKRGVPATFEIAKAAGHNFRNELAAVAVPAVRKLLGP
jgi:hypothetical protein